MAMPVKELSKIARNLASYPVYSRYNELLIFLFKILNGLICIPNQCLPSPFPITTTRSRHPIKLQQLYTRTDIYHYSFLPRTIPDWNNLRIDNINELDLIQFKDFVINL